jgi:PAS domain-containing protein
MNYEEMDRSSLLEELDRMLRKIEGMKEASRRLEVQLQNKDREILRLQRELEDRIAGAITRETGMRTDSERFASLVANLPGAVYRCANDAFWTMEYLSDQIAQLSGYPAVEFINNAVRSYKSIIHPEDVIKVVNAVNNGVNDHRPYTIDYRLRHRDGSIRHVCERGTGVFAEDGTLRWLDGVIFDQSFINSYSEITLPEW